MKSKKELFIGLISIIGVAGLVVGFYFLKGQEVSRGNEVTPWRTVPQGTPYGKLMKKICG